MTVRDLFKILALSPKSIEIQFYNEQNNIYDSLHNKEEYEVLYIKDWQIGTYTIKTNVLEQYTLYKSRLCLSVVIAPPKTKNWNELAKKNENNE